MIKLASWNVNSLRTRLQQVIDWINENQPDLLGLQELKMPDDAFPNEILLESGYQSIWHGQKTYNGVALLSKKIEFKNVEKGMPGFEDPQSRVIAGSFKTVRVINAYVPNGQSVGSEKFEYKLAWLEAFYDYIKKQLAQYPYLVVMGDFNIAPEDRDVHDPKGWEGHVLVSPAERKAFQKLVHLGLQDSFRCFEQAEKSYTWWDYRRLGFQLNKGLRIDHILISKPLAQGIKASYIDKAPRKLKQPSDHTPIVTECMLPK